MARTNNLKKILSGILLLTQLASYTVFADQPIKGPSSVVMSQDGLHAMFDQAVQQEEKKRRSLNPEHIEKINTINQEFEAILSDIQINKHLYESFDRVIFCLSGQCMLTAKIRAMIEATQVVNVHRVLSQVLADHNLLRFILILNHMKLSSNEQEQQEAARIEAEIKKNSTIPAVILEECFLSKIATIKAFLDQGDHTGLAAYREKLDQEAFTAFCQINEMAQADQDKLPEDFKDPVAFAVLNAYCTRTNDKSYDTLALLIDKLAPRIDAFEQEIMLVINEFNAILIPALEDRFNDLGEDARNAYESVVTLFKEYLVTVRNVKLIGQMAINKDVNRMQKEVTFLNVLHQASDLFDDLFKLYKADCSDQALQGASSSFFDKRLVLPYLAKMSFFTAQLTMHYELHKTKKSAKYLSDFAHAENDRERFITLFGSQVPVFEGALLCPADKAIKADAMRDALKDILEKETKGFLLGKNSTVDKLIFLSEGKSFFLDKARSMMIDALYFYGMHMKFTPVGEDNRTLKSFKPWVKDTLAIVDWSSAKIGKELSSLFYTVLSPYQLEQAERFSLGIVTPSIGSKVMSIAKAGFLSHAMFQPCINAVVSYDREYVYGNEMYRNFPGVTDSQRFALYADRELFSFGVGSVARFLGGKFARYNAGLLVAATKKIAGLFMDKEELVSQEKTIDCLKLAVADALAVLLGGEHCDEAIMQKDILEGLKSHNPQQAAMAQQFFNYALMGRAKLLKYFDLREDADNLHATNHALLENVLYKILYVNPLGVKFVNGYEYSDILAMYDQNPDDLGAIASMIIEKIQLNIVEHVGGLVCGSIAEWQARDYWNARKRPFIFGKDTVEAA